MALPLKKANEKKKHDQHQIIRILFGNFLIREISARFSNQDKHEFHFDWRL